MAEVAIFTPRKRKLTSIVWNYYDRIKNDDGTCVARCKHCKKQLNGASRSGTTHLRKHLESCLPLQLKKSRQRKLTSPVWNEYDRIKNGDGSCVARCKHCNRQLTGASKSGTTHLRKHLDACPCYKGLKENFQDVGPLLLESGDLSKDGTSSLQDFKFDQDVSRLDLARMIILHEYPFSIVHHVGFKTFVKNLQPSFKMMSRNTIKADCMKIIEKERKKLYEILDKLPSRVSLTADLWSSDQNSGYLCLTGHYIDDDWKLQKRILNFCMLEEPLVGESIAKTIMEKLFEWNIDRKLLSIVLDNSTTNDEVVQELVKILAPKGSLFMSCDVFHVRCFANILNLMAQDGMEVIDDVINKVRESIKFVKSTDQRQQRFKDVAAQVGVLEKCLVLDVSTRWNSTYMMLESALDFKDAFFCLAELDSEYAHVPSFEEWDNVKTVHSRLKSFYDVMQVLSCARYPTANIYFAEVCCIYLLLKEWRMSTQPSIASMASKMMQKFEKYWQITNLVLAIAAILDPRLKMKPIEFYFPLIYGSNDVQQKIADVRVSLTNLYNEYVNRSALTSINRGLPWNVESNCSSPSNECGVSGASEVSSCSTRIDRRRGLDKFLQETSSTQQIKSDLEMYLEEAVYPVQNGLDENFDILAWWKFCGPKYPIVAQMARDILGIPVSTVVSEVAFSTGSRVLDQYRSSMHPSTVQSLVCAQDWLRNEIQESINGSLDGLSLSTVTTAVDPDGEVDLCMTMSTDDEF